MTDHVCGDCSILPAGYTCTSCCLYDCRQQRDALLAALQAVDGFVATGSCCPVCSQHPHDQRCMVVRALAKAEGLTAHGS